MSRTPEKADPYICPSTSHFPGEPTYECTIAGWHPHKLHIDEENHRRWFDTIPDLPISAWQADWLEQIGALSSGPALGFMMTGHENTDRLLTEQTLWNAKIAGVTQTPMVYQKESDTMTKNRLEHLGLPEVAYTLYADGAMRPLDPEAAKVDHVMMRNGEFFGVARVTKGAPAVGEPLPGDWHDPFAGLVFEEPTAASEAQRLEAIAKLARETFSQEHARRVTELGEVRTTSSTGGEKGTKPARFDLIPIMPLTRLAEHYAAGAAKYDAHQWRKGYEMSKSYAAAQRHLTAFWDGEDNDPEMGTPHLAAVMFHAMAMMQFLQDFPQHDDRYKKEI